MDFGPLLKDSGPIVMDSGRLVQTGLLMDFQLLVETAAVVDSGSLVMDFGPVMMDSEPLVEIVPLMESGWLCLILIIFKWLVKNIVVTFDEAFNFCQSLYYVDLCLCDVVYCCL